MFTDYLMSSSKAYFFWKLLKRTREITEEEKAFRKGVEGWAAYMRPVQ